MFTKNEAFLDYPTFSLPPLPINFLTPFLDSRGGYFQFLAIICSRFCRVVSRFPGAGLSLQLLEAIDPTNSTISHRNDSGRLCESHAKSRESQLP